MQGGQDEEKEMHAAVVIPSERGLNKYSLLRAVRNVSKTTLSDIRKNLRNQVGERLINGGVPRNPVFLMPATDCIRLLAPTAS